MTRRSDDGVSRRALLESRPPPVRLRRVVALLLLSVLASCEPPRAPWMSESVPEPRLFAPGVVSTDEREYGIAFTPDGTEAYFTRRSRRGSPQIFVSRLLDGSWSDPTPAPFSADAGDEAPHITSDGSRMLFGSRRWMAPARDRSQNIWIMERGPQGWSAPAPLRGSVNQPEREFEDFTAGAESGPVLLRDGSLLYWARAEAEWGSDLYVAEQGDGGWVAPRPLRINSYGDESHPAMSPDGDYLVFQAYRDARGFGDQDLYVSERTSFGWSDPRPLPSPINSDGADGWPSFSPDGRHFFFASDRDARGGYYDIWWVDVAALDLDGEGAGGG